MQCWLWRWGVRRAKVLLSRLKIDVGMVRQEPRPPEAGKISLTNSTSIRLPLIAGLANRQPAVAAARIEPTVTQPFDAIEEHVGSVYRYALRLTGQPDLAEDLTQETFLRGWRNRRKLRDVRAGRVWLLRIATNLWTDQLRRGRFRAVSLESEPPCPRVLPAKTDGLRENVRLALATMDILPPRQRQVLYLVTCESIGQAEVATILGISESAVKANLSLARQEMRRRLKNLYEEVCGRRAPSEV
jgi:RNA polymerase sigma factor (sigma-70 family)